MPHPSARLSLSAAIAALCAPSAAAQFALDNSGNPTGPGIASSSENVDFGDVDLDGDWDAVFADGGDDGNDQNRIWMNRGGAQGGPIGTFVDQTSTRLPVLQDDSRDIEFADIDNDGDLDIYISNTAQLVSQGNHWWVNKPDGSGNLGFYTDETAARWIGLGVNPNPGAPGGSSVAATLVGGGTFIDWSCDCDFGDLDNDGDLDLVHSSYGGAFGGNVPTRLFLNDGEGRFEEFNPGGGQLTGNNIGNGQPAIWAEGIHFSNTTSSDGTAADIASSALDIDLGDIDGDFDLDILHGARQEAPRLFKNMLEESIAAGQIVNNGIPGNPLPAFRDVTNAAFPSGWSSGDGHYEQEMADFDGDGDLDIYGLNWNTGFFSFTDITLRNDGSGNFGNLTTLASSGADDNEGDFVDYDNDGDLDLFVANFSGADKLYRNDGNGNYGSPVQTISGGTPSLDADAADIDKDGDYDLIIAEDDFASNKTLINVTQIPDTHAPYIPNVENKGDRTAAPGVFPVRAQVYDNAPYYITWYNPTSTEVSVNGYELADIPSMSSQGQIFRTELPANLVGDVDYVFKSQDEYGNAGQSAVESYTATTGLAFANTFGSGTAGQTGVPTLEALSVPYAGDTLYVAADGITPNVPYALYVTDAGLPSPLSLPSIGNLNITGTILLELTGVTDAAGQAVFGLPVPGNLPGGFSLFFQIFGVDGQFTNLVSTSAGLEVVTQ